MRRPEEAAVSFPLEADLLDDVAGGASSRILVREQEGVAVVLGRGNAAAREVREQACRADGVPVLRRLGGGGAVVLGPGCLVVTLVKTVARELHVGRYMEQIVDLIGDCVGGLTGLTICSRGSGDLCVGDRKILGSSLFRRKRLLLYEGSLLVSMDLSLVDRYLFHPSREPEYRRGRPHAEFLTSLKRCGIRTGCRDLARDLRAELSLRVEDIV